MDPRSGQTDTGALFSIYGGATLTSTALGIVRLQAASKEEGPAAALGDGAERRLRSAGGGHIPARRRYLQEIVP
jgi:hypothetical protein